MAVRETKLGPRGTARREEILDAAVELFARHGYRGTGLVALGKQVGMSHVGILSYFGTKEGLLMAVIARHDQPIEAQEGKYEGAGIVDILTIGPTDVADVLIRLDTVLRAENLNPGDPLYEHFRTQEHRARSLLVSAIRADQARGLVRADIDPEAKAVELNGYGHGLDIQWLMDPDHIDRDAAYRSFARAQIADLTGVDTTAPMTSPRPKRSRR